MLGLCLPHSLADVWTKLQALVYDILLSTTAVFSYIIGPRKLSAFVCLLFFACLFVLKQ